jgi:hypothetical protein
MANNLPTEKWPLRESADLVECWTSSTTANLLPESCLVWCPNGQPIAQIARHGRVNAMSKRKSANLLPHRRPLRCANRQLVLLVGEVLGKYSTRKSGCSVVGEKLLYSADTLRARSFGASP